MGERAEEPSRQTDSDKNGGVMPIIRLPRGRRNGRQNNKTNNERNLMTARLFIVRRVTPMMRPLAQHQSQSRLFQKSAQPTDALPAPPGQYRHNDKR
jgi:hypothetical protein